MAGGEGSRGRLEQEVSCDSLKANGGRDLRKVGGWRVRVISKAGGRRGRVAGGRRARVVIGRRGRIAGGRKGRTAGGSKEG